MSPEPARRSGSSVRRNLVLFALALTLPALLFAASILAQYGISERTRLEREAAELASSIASAVDRELTGLLAALDVLTTSRALANGDLAAFRQQAAEILQRQGLLTILSDVTGQLLVYPRAPDGEPLPKSNPRWSLKELEGPSFITDLIVGQITGTRQFLVVAPIRSGGEIVQLLQFSVPLSRLQRILDEAGVPPYQLVIVDRQGIVMARFPRADEFVGGLSAADFRQAAKEAQGFWTGKTLTGTPAFGAYTRSRVSGFRASVAIPNATLNAPLWRSLALLAGVGAALAGLSALLAVYVGRRITKSIAALSREALKLGRGEPVAPLATGLVEADEVGAELATASTNLREREADLRDANEEMQRFAYIVSHDLRSPLVNIMGFTTELEAVRADVFRRLDELRAATALADGAKDVELGRDFDEAIGFIKASIAKMDRLINAILRLSREGRREFHPARVDMDALIEGIKASLTIQAEEADATVTASRLPPVVSDRLALEQIFSNLVDNALKYLRRGVPGRVEIIGRTDGAVLVYEVRDNGRGIEAKDSERVFDLFRRSGVQDRPGEGIGLAHVRTLVRRLGGTISLTSERGQGSSFTVTLPRRWAGERQRKAA